MPRWNGNIFGVACATSMVCLRSPHRPVRAKSGCAPKGSNRSFIAKNSPILPVFAGRGSQVGRFRAERLCAFCLPRVAVGLPASFGHVREQGPVGETGIGRDAISQP